MNSISLDNAEIETIYLWVDHMYDRMVADDPPVNSEEMSDKVLEQFAEVKLTIGQLVAFRFRGKILKLVVKDMEVSGLQLDDYKVETGRLTSNTKVWFEVIPGSVLRLTGSAIYLPHTTAQHSTLRSRFFKSLFFMKKS